MSLQPSKSGKVNLAFASPKDLSNGSYYLLTEIVPGSTITDADTTNNIFVGGSTVAVTEPYVDLTDKVVLVGKSTSYTVGSKKQQPIRFTIGVTNAGNVTAKGPMAIDFYGSQNITLDTQDPLLDALPTRKLSIRPGATSKVTLSMKPTTATPSGTFYGIAEVDSNSGILNRMTATIRRAPRRSSPSAMRPSPCRPRCPAR